MKTKINQTLGKRQLYYTKNKHFSWRSELISMTGTKSGTVITNISEAFNYSAFLSRRAEDFCDIAQLSCDEDTHRVQNQTR